MNLLFYTLLLQLDISKETTYYFKLRKYPVLCLDQVLTTMNAIINNIR